MADGGRGTATAAAQLAPVLYRARRQLRHRRGRRSGAVLLVGLLSGVTLAALIGARRNDTAYDRMLEPCPPVGCARQP